MNKYFVITIDTESDWYNQKENRLNNIDSIHDFQKICSRYNILPTYLITYEIMKDKNAVDVLKKYHSKDLCEIGSHLHIWSTPPFENKDSFNIDINWFHGFQSELPQNLLYDKLENLSKKIFNTFGKYPTSHRAGRWGVDLRTIKWLEDNKYLVDSSICSRKTWRFSKGVNEFINYDSFKVKDKPYYPSINNILYQGNENYNILEVPVSNLKLNYLNDTNRKSISAINTILNKIGIYYFGNISFRPSYNIELEKYDTIVENLFKRNKKILNFMLHSNELSLGSSPYSLNKTLHKNLIDRIQIVFEKVNKYGYKSIFLSNVSDYQK